MSVTTAVFQQGKRMRFLWLAVPLLLTPILLSQSAWPSETLPRQGMEFMGSAFIILCVAGRCWASLYIGGRKNRELITNGPYKYTRNPLYFFSSLGLAGIGLTFGSLAIAAFYFLFGYLVFAYVSARESTALDGLFGDAYREYCHKVPAFFPRLRRSAGDVAHQLSLTFNPVVLKRTAIDSSCFLLAIPGSELIESLQLAKLLKPLLQLF
ncbi:isoprenylcysteine carboxylmethyltransferase family protein [Mesorhizobium sp. CGMCC 1.15528]|uniref:Isoprenylcysteine carboxylmethyltransferase family protein n=1 Tax=Mesorhizobium zhangyense TaxID=1776730 RepID=A0A7C9RAW0_9HYPH|nr:isoprenylcysteine carboxylmethyltransferase family protein [Mesorhizobium zhangyense]NGN44541.1 isoprenylcysteine carboxylmethyltransferase family protein [Mesorhizobium zhangyense]